MKFNVLVEKILEDFRAPTGTSRSSIKPHGKYGTINPQLNEPHCTKSVSGFKGQLGGKMSTLTFTLPKRGKKKKLPRRR